VPKKQLRGVFNMSLGVSPRKKQEQKIKKHKNTKWQPEVITNSVKRIPIREKEKLMTELGSLLYDLITTVTNGAL